MKAFHSVPAQEARPLFSIIPNNGISSESKNRLDRISNGEPVATVYQDENRSWWELVDNDMVYTAIDSDDFQAYVRLIIATA
jgi:hypothetical protein